MFAIMPLPIFPNDSSRFRPASPSPLFTSPIRASGSSSPLGPKDQNMLPRREIKSSPIPETKFKFATRPARHNPIVQKREAAQETRRKLFLKNVRQRADDQKWERRGGDQELLKLEWFSESRSIQRAKNADLEGMVSEAEIEDAPQLQEQPTIPGPPDDPDEMMVDVIAQEEEAELDAMISSFFDDPPSTESRRPESPQLSDDEDYDALFTNLIAEHPEGNDLVDINMS